MGFRIRFFVLCLLLALGACQQSDQDAGPVDAQPNDVTQLRMRHFPAERVARGARLFKQHCAQCHGPEAQGHPSWQTPSMKYAAAPPLNGTGNDWKRSRVELIFTILNGASRDGVAVMPPWKNRLSRRDTEDLMIWFQALWPAEVYKKWLEDNPDNLMASSDKAKKPKTGKTMEKNSQ
ncbi:MAG TPA: c-type cytochrome [Acidiferrobacteraceae bacterium]|nr:c-type cytochrome [Acidiferrobacteraceae bacterium]HEX20519.1 c-type cytochrome [Acidiferrobacteraceae bacterium]